MPVTAAKPPTPPPAPTAQPTPPVAPAPGTAAPTASANPYADYDLSTATSDYANWRTPYTIWVTDALLPIDAAAELREPLTPYVEIIGDTGNGSTGNTVTQWIDTTLRNYGDSLSAFIRTEQVRVRASAEDNPAASADDRADTEAAIRFDLQYQDAVLVGDQLEERKDMLKYRGEYYVQHVPLSDAESAELNGMKIRSDLHDTLDVARMVGVDNRLERCIIQKRRVAAELPPSWLALAGIDDRTRDVVVVEYFDCWQHGALIEGQIAKALTPHGYVDMDGRPAVPITLVMHTPRTIRQGHVPPQASGISQRGVRVGVPLMYALLTEHVKRSRLMTLAMHAARTGSVPLIEIKGMVEGRDEADGVDFESGVVEVEDTPSSGVRFVAPADASPALKVVLDAINQDLAAASTAPGIMQGQVTQNVPGVSQNGMTSWARSKAESLALTLGKGLTAEASMRIAIYRQVLVAPTARQYQRAAGVPLTPHLGTQSPLMNDGVTLAIGGGKEVDNLTFADIRRVTVQVVADNRMPLEQEMQLAVTLAGVKTADGQPLVSRRWLHEHLLHLPNAEQVEHDIALETLAANPKTPYGQIATLRAMLATWRTEVPDPTKLATYEKQLAALTEQALAFAFQEATTELQQSLTQQPAGGPPQGAPPPPGAPQGGPSPPGPMPPPGPPMAAPPSGPPPSGPPPPPLTNFPPPPGMQPGPMPLRPPGQAPSPLIASGPLGPAQPPPGL